MKRNFHARQVPRVKLVSKNYSYAEPKTENGSLAPYRIENSIFMIAGQGEGRETREAASRLEEKYLRYLIADSLESGRLTSVHQGKDKGAGVGLERVYVPQLIASHKHPKPQLPASGAALQQETILDALNNKRRLVVVAPAGRGKTSFINHMTLCLAGELLGEQDYNIKVLTGATLPDRKNESQIRDQAWNHGPLVPVRIIPRDFVESKFFPTPEQVPKSDHLLRFIEDDLADKGFSPYFPVVIARLAVGGALVVLDGLDEVSTAAGQRERLIQCLHDFADSCGKIRLVVASRPYAYNRREWQGTEFERIDLADFNKVQIRYFIDTWFAAYYEPDAEPAKTRADMLKRALWLSSGLFELVKCPMHLAMVAVLHAADKALPEQDGELYEQFIALLIEQWGAVRMAHEEDGPEAGEEHYTLAEFLRVDLDGIRLVLERLAFKVFASRGGPFGGFGIAALDLANNLVCLAVEKKRKQPPDSLRIREYLRDRIGILKRGRCGGAGGAIYCFTHRRFQEYLAASYFHREENRLLAPFAKQGVEEWQDVAGLLGRADLDRWREVLLLAGSIEVAKKPGPVWRLVDKLARQPVSSERLSAEESRGFFLSGEILGRYLAPNLLKSNKKRIFSKIRDNLPSALRSSHLAAADRVSVGLHLAEIGDPRNEVISVDAMRFCMIGKGIFFLGGTETDDPECKDEQVGSGKYDLGYTYWLGRYPVTVAQYRMFVEDTGYTPNCLRNPANTPVVAITWYEGMKFCEWLGKRWRSKGWLPEGYWVTLPSEPEWEKAARGGYKIPKNNKGFVVGIAKCLAVQKKYPEGHPKVMANPFPRRTYPWGKEADVELMNYVDSGIGHASPVGVYPDGVSPYGCEEMSGNVLEWTRSRYKPYPYPRNRSGILEREVTTGTSERTFRGGAFFESAMRARCAARGGNYPGYSGYIGFRVCLTPMGQSGLTLWEQPEG